ncbi:hypothetical protein NL676_032087 [Syzygium grande]|nr:hypothetical protein NL676_032087 [Syzygium grande]
MQSPIWGEGCALPQIGVARPRRRLARAGEGRWPWASGVLPLFDNFKLSSLSPTHFAQVLHYALRSVKHFAKSVVCEMETANWNLDEAIRFIEPRARFAKPSHRHFTVESFVAKSIFEGFNFLDFVLANESPSSVEERSPQAFFDQFKKLKSASPASFVARNPSSPFARFVKAKYLQLVHAKMECSFFRNLNHWKAVSSGGSSAFRKARARAAAPSRRLWRRPPAQLPPARNTERRDKREEREDLSSSLGVCLHDHDQGLHDQKLFLLLSLWLFLRSSLCHLSKLAAVREKVVVVVPTSDNDDDKEPLRPLALGVPAVCAEPTSHIVEALCPVTTATTCFLSWPR